MRISIFPLLMATMVPLAPALSCVPFVLDVTGELVKHPGTISLNSDGSWSIKDWATVEEAPKAIGHNDLANCIVKGLLSRPPGLWINNTPSAAGHGEPCSTKAMQAVVDLDPIARQCGVSLQ